LLLIAGRALALLSTLARLVSLLPARLLALSGLLAL
jgi:hypothetical protein